MKKQLVHAFLNSRLAWGVFVVYVMMVWSGQSPILIGVIITIAAILFMNNLGQTKYLLTDSVYTKFFSESSNLIMRIIHKVFEKGELAGIFLGVASLALIVWTTDASWFETMKTLPVKSALTLLGIMSAASMASHYIMPLFEKIEKSAGVYGVILFGSLLAGLMGGPAVAILLPLYLGSRISRQNKGKVASGLSATIGIGAGWTWIAAPPILIIADKIQTHFHMQLSDMVLYLGFAALIYIAIAAMKIVPYINTEHETLVTRTDASFKKGIIPIIVLVLVIILHLIDFVYVSYIDILLGIRALSKGVAGFAAHKEELSETNTSYVRAIQRLYKKLRFRDSSEDREYQLLKQSVQPMILAMLLLALDVVGVMIEPAIFAMTEFIPTDFPVLALAIILFFICAWTSHFAANSLASRIFIMVPIGLIPTMGLEVATMLALAVILGCLFGGFLLIPAYLPNFEIAQRLGNVSPSERLKGALPMYGTVIVMLLIIAVYYGSFLGAW